MEIITETRFWRLEDAVTLPLGIVRCEGAGVAIETSSQVERPFEAGVTQLITDDGGTIEIPSDARVRLTIHVDDGDVTVALPAGPVA